MTSYQKRSHERAAIGTGAIIAIVVVIVIVAGGGYFLLSQAPSQPQSSSQTSTTQTPISLSTTSSVTTSTTSTTTSSSTTTPAKPGTVKVLIPKGVGVNQSLNFLPATLTVVLGVNNTIIWTNEDPIPHTVTSTSVPTGASSFDSSTMSQGQIFKLTLTVPGTYQYYCTIHPNWMKATIIVKAAATGY